MKNVEQPHSDAGGVCTGMARFTCHDPHNIYDIIPCDLVGSGVLVSAAAVAQVWNACIAPLQSFPQGCIGRSH